MAYRQIIEYVRLPASVGHCTISPNAHSAAHSRMQFGRSSESTLTGSDLDSDTYQVADKAKKLANDVTALAGQLQNTRIAERRRPLMPLVCALCARWKVGSSDKHGRVDSMLPRPTKA